MKKKVLKQELALARQTITELGKQNNALLSALSQMKSEAEQSASLLSLEDLKRQAKESANLTPVWIQESSGMVWAAVLDLDSYGVESAIYGFNLWFTAETYGKDWVAWDKPPMPTQIKSVAFGHKQYLFGDKGAKHE